MTYSEKIVKLRKANGYSQETFAKAVGVSRQAVYKWESGISYPEAEKLVEIKKLLGIKIDDLLDDSYEVVIEKKPVEKKKSEAAKAEEVKETVTPPSEELPSVAVEEKKEEVKTVHAEQPKAPQKKAQSTFGGFVSGLFGRRKK